MDFVLLDETHGAKTTNGESLTPELLAKAAQFLVVYLNRFVGAYWGIPGGANVRAGSSPTDILTNELPVHDQATLPDAPDAIAYHTINGLGMPDLYDGITLSDSLFGPGNSWLVALSHELVETVVDPGANRWAADNQGRLLAIEAADPVEVQSFPITIGTLTAYVSNFVLPSYFVPGHAGPYDYMTLAKLAGAVAPTGPFKPAVGNGGNYQVMEKDPRSESQVFALSGKRVHFDGSIDHRLAKKKMPSSRASRRGLVL